jgi:hypothetical protein
MNEETVRALETKLNEVRLEAKKRTVIKMAPDQYFSLYLANPGITNGMFLPSGRIIKLVTALFDAPKGTLYLSIDQLHESRTIDISLNKGVRNIDKEIILPEDSAVLVKFDAENANAYMIVGCVFQGKGFHIVEKGEEDA